MRSSVERHMVFVEDTEDTAPALESASGPNIIDTVAGDIHVDDGLLSL